jgi:uncharacterized membrane protein (DUF485 family)
VSPFNISVIVFVCVFGGALLGLFASPLLPDRLQSSESRDVVRLGMGLVATTVAIVLGLLVASAKGFYDTQSTEVTQAAANFVLLDRILGHYGPETKDTRATVRNFLAHVLDSLGPPGKVDYSSISSGARDGEVILDKIQDLSPKDDNQRYLKAQALNLAFQLGQIRWLMFEQNTVPVPNFLLFMLVGWVIVLFLSFGLFAPRNFTVLSGLFLAAVAICGAILLILEMYHPASGVIRVSDAPLRAAMAQLGH